MSAAYHAENNVIIAADVDKTLVRQGDPEEREWFFREIALRLAEVLRHG